MKTEKLAWGTRLTTHPLQSQPEMYIQADVKAGAKPEVKIWFSGPTVRHPLRRADALIWLESFKAILDAALKS